MPYKSEDCGAIFGLWCAPLHCPRCCISNLSYNFVSTLPLVNICVGNRAIWLWFRHYTLYICASLLFTRQIFHLPILLGKCSSSLFANGIRLVYRHSTRIFGLPTLLRYRCHRECFTIHRGRFLKANERLG